VCQHRSFLALPDTKFLTFTLLALARWSASVAGGSSSGRSGGSTTELVSDNSPLITSVLGSLELGQLSHLLPIGLQKIVISHWEVTRVVPREGKRYTYISFQDSDDRLQESQVSVRETDWLAVRSGE